MQKLILIGNIGKDAEVKEFGDNKVINFSLACTETWTKAGEKQSKTTWYEVAKWGQNTNVAQYLKKGTQVFIEGTPEADAYTSKNGDAVGVLRVKAFNIQLLGNKDSNTQNQTEASQPAYDKPTVDKSNEEDNGLPFS